MMNFRAAKLCMIFLTTAFFFVGCGDNNDDSNNDNPSTPENITAAPSAAQMLEAGKQVEYTFSGLKDSQAYRVTLVVDGNVTTSGNAGTFVDNDDNGAADAGASEKTALIVSVNGEAQTGAKTR